MTSAVGIRRKTKMIDRIWKLSLAVGLTLGLCAVVLAIVGGSHFRWTTGENGANISIQIGIEAGEITAVLGTIAVIMLVLGSAFLAVSKQQNAMPAVKEAPDTQVFSFLEFLQRLRKSEKDYQIGSVCGGLGEHTPVPSWIWRMLFLVLFFCVGVGLIPYIILWICMPAGKKEERYENTNQPIHQTR